MLHLSPYELQTNHVIIFVYKSSFSDLFPKTSQLQVSYHLENPCFDQVKYVPIVISMKTAKEHVQTSAQDPYTLTPKHPITKQHECCSCQSAWRLECNAQRQPPGSGRQRPTSGAAPQNARFHVFWPRVFAIFRSKTLSQVPYSPKMIKGLTQGSNT